MLRGPWLGKGGLEVVRNGYPDCLESLLGTWESERVETFPLGMNLGPVVLTDARHQVI